MRIAIGNLTGIGNVHSLKIQQFPELAVDNHGNALLSWPNNHAVKIETARLR